MSRIEAYMLGICIKKKGLIFAYVSLKARGETFLEALAFSCVAHVAHPNDDLAKMSSAIFRGVKVIIDIRVHNTVSIFL